jgi:membrane protease YdiL (CAAX protease family)
MSPEYTEAQRILLIGFFALLMASLATGAVYLRGIQSGAFTPPWLLDRAPALPLPWIWVVGFVWLLGLLILTVPSWAALAGLSLPVLALTLHRFQPSQHWGLHPASIPPSIFTAGRAYLLILPLVYLSALLTAVLFHAAGFDLAPQSAVQFLAETNDPKQLLSLLLLAVVFAPLWEEVAFRGFLYPALKARVGRPTALLLSSLLFASMHQHPPTFLPLMILGIALALVYEYTGSLLAPMALHAVFNGATCAMILLYYRMA